jgi:hypothetical protein
MSTTFQTSQCMPLTYSEILFNWIDDTTGASDPLMRFEAVGIKPIEGPFVYRMRRDDPLLLHAAVSFPPNSYLQVKGLH